MGATVKHRRSGSWKRRTNSQNKPEKLLPALKKKASGKYVPANLVTKENPSKKGVQFVKTAK